MNRAIVTYGLCCVLLVACGESSVEPDTAGQRLEPLRGGHAFSFDAVPPPAGTRQCRSLNNFGRLDLFDPALYKMPIDQPPLQACLTTYFGTPHAYHYSYDDPNWYYVDPVTLTFSQPVYSVVIEAVGTYPCNSTDLGHTTAYDAAGAAVYSGTFVVQYPEQQCGADQNYGILVDTVRSASPIKSLTITAPSPLVWELPPAWSPLQGHVYTTYNVIAYESPCPPLAEQVLNDPAVRAALLQALAASRISLNDGTNRREHGGYVYLRDDGTPFLVEELRSGFTECASNLLPVDSIPAVPGAHLAGYWHTHPNKDFEPYYSTDCKGGPNMPPGQVKKAGERDATGGGSEGDWNWADTTSKPVYVIDIFKHVARLDPGTPKEKWSENKNKWKFDNQQECLSLR